MSRHPSPREVVRGERQAVLVWYETIHALCHCVDNCCVGPDEIATAIKLDLLHLSCDVLALSLIKLCNTLLVQSVVFIIVEVRDVLGACWKLVEAGLDEVFIAGEEVT